MIEPTREMNIGGVTTVHVDTESWPEMWAFYGNLKECVHRFTTCSSILF